ncbi:MAG: WD40 repeat domain-containing serine/threonine-protein kinase, partial [Cyanobacteria bacterium J06635_10]
PVIQFIHERGVIHRDIKPQNIIRRSSGKDKVGDLVLIDFGSSKDFKPKLQFQIGTSIGSHGYSPIEQIRDGIAYPASDLFSVGATCFHLITGISPFKLWTEYGYSWMGTWEKYLNYPISDEFADILNKLLHKDIQQRYQSATEVIVDLQQPHKYPVVSPSLTEIDEQLVPPTEIPSIPRKYTQLKSLLIASAAVLVFLAGEFWYWGNREAQIRNPDKIIEPNIQPTANTETVVHGDAHNPMEFALSQTINLNYDLTSSIAIAPDSKTMVTNSIFGVKLWSLLTKQEISLFNAHNLKVNVVAIDSDGTKFVSAGDDKTIKVWNLATGQEIRTLQGHTQPIHTLAFSPNGKILASSGLDNSVKLWDVNTGKEIVSFDSHNHRVSSLAFDSEGTMLASADFDGSIKIWDTTTQKLLRTLPSVKSRVYSIKFIKTGISSNSIVGSYNNVIGMWNPTTGEKIRIFRGHSQSVISIAVNAQSNIMASASSDKTIKLWNLSTGELLSTIKGHSGKVKSLAFSRDGNMLVSCASDRTIKIWQRSNF